MAQEFIKPILADPEFYINSMSLFMRESFGMKDRCRYYVDVLKNVLDVGEEHYNRINIFSLDEITGEPNYFTMAGVNPTGTTDVYLDAIAAAFGLSRQLVLPDAFGESQSITLTNEELLIYIQFTIFKNTYDGSNEMLLQIYTGSPIPYYSSYTNPPEFMKATYFPTFVTNLFVKYKTDDTLAATIFMTSASSNLKLLMLNGYLTIESLGIVYERNVGAKYEVGEFGTARFYLPGYDTIYTFGAEE